MTTPRFRDRLTGVSTGSSRSTVPVVVGSLLAPVGLVLIGLGWLGASRTPLVQEQLPYLISGGIIGLGLSVVGGLVYFGSWVARTNAEQQRKNEEMTEILREIRDELRHGAPTPVTASTARRTSAANGAKPFVATQRGGMMHRPDCAVVAGRTDLRRVGASGDGLTPCTLCSPLDVDVLTS